MTVILSGLGAAFLYFLAPPRDVLLVRVDEVEAHIVHITRDSLVLAVSIALHWHALPLVATAIPLVLVGEGIVEVLDVLDDLVVALGECDVKHVDALFALELLLISVFKDLLRVEVVDLHGCDVMEWDDDCWL